MVLRGSRSRTGFARLVPGFSNIIGTAAHLFSHVEGELILTCVIEVTVTHTFPHVHAIVSTIDLHVFRGTNTGVVAQSVIAGTRPTDSNVGCAFINIFTDASLLIEIVTSWTFTLETAKGVHTVSTLAETWQLLALVDIFQDDSDRVGSESLSSWTESLIFRRVGGRAKFTGVSPGPS